MKTALKQYERDATKVLQRFVNTIEATSPPPMVYHYTNDAGLRGIIESGKLWFSDIFGLNDPSELRHGLAAAIDALKSRSSDERPEIATFASCLERFDLDGGIEAAAHFFICSFSGDGDDLGQWRAYADNGRGFALGFETSSLEDCFCRRNGKPIPQHSTFPVTYDDGELTRIQTAFADLVDPLISFPRRVRLRSSVMHRYMSDLLVYHSMNVIRAVMFFKHEGYRNETEYRFQQLFRYDRSAPDVLYRQRPYSMVRYREFDWRTAAGASLKEIIVGPAADRAKATQFVKDCLTAFHPNSDQVKIGYSRIPYRAA
ncbi:MAG: DUF2971 domain-containing protein [Xanthobacteraceae bacterium]